MNRKYHSSCNVVDDQTFLEVKHLFSQIICSNRAKESLFCTLKQKCKFQTESHLIPPPPRSFQLSLSLFNLALSVPSLLAHYPSVSLSVCLFLTKFLTLTRNTSIPRLRAKALSYFFQIAPIDVFWPSSESRLRFEMNGDELIEKPCLYFSSCQLWAHMHLCEVLAALIAGVSVQHLYANCCVVMPLITSYIASYTADGSVCDASVWSFISVRDLLQWQPCF